MTGKQVPLSASDPAPVVGVPVTGSLPAGAGSGALEDGVALRERLGAGANTRQGSEILAARSESWVLVERYVERYPHDWRLVFRRDETTLDVSVPEEVWRAFDGITV